MKRGVCSTPWLCGFQFFSFALGHGLSDGADLWIIYGNQAGASDSQGAFLVKLSSAMIELEMDKLSKNDIKILGRFFQVCELEGRLIQGDSKGLRSLEERKLVERTEFTLSGRFPVTVKGWRFTLKGHMAYCETCR